MWKWRKSRPPTPLRDEVWNWPHEPKMNWFGWWAEEMQRPPVVRLLQVIRAVLIPSHLIFYGTLLYQTSNEFRQGTIISTVKSAFVSGPSTVACFKLYTIVRHRKSLKEITNSMDVMMKGILSRPVTAELEEEMRSRWKSCRKLYNVCVYFGCTVTAHASVTPLLQTIAGALLTDDPLPFDSWPYFLMGYYCWALNTFCIGHVLYMFDATWFAMADNLQIHIAVLKNYLENLDLTRRGEIDLNLCLKNHMELIRLCRIFRRISRTVIVTTRMCSMLLLCAGTFVLTSFMKYLAESEDSFCPHPFPEILELPPFYNSSEFFGTSKKAETGRRNEKLRRRVKRVRRIVSEEKRLWSGENSGIHPGVSSFAMMHLRVSDRERTAAQGKRLSITISQSSSSSVNHSVNTEDELEAGPEFTPNDRGNLLSTLIYIAAVFFNYCRCADNIAHQLDELTTDCYSAQWVNAEKSQKTSILNMMAITRMEPKFCGIASIDLDTFVNVMRGVYSYYNFLTAVDVVDDAENPAKELNGAL